MRDSRWPGRRGVARRARALLALGLVALAGVAQAATVTDIEFASRPGSKFEIRVDFDSAPPEIKSYTIEKPARLAIDFPGTTSAVANSINITKQRKL